MGFRSFDMAGHCMMMGMMNCLGSWQLTPYLFITVILSQMYLPRQDDERNLLPGFPLKHGITGRPAGKWNVRLLSTADAEILIVGLGDMVKTCFYIDQCQ